MSGVYKIYRHDSQPFAQVPNSAIRDPEISPNAFRLLAYLMSHKEGYELTYGQIERQTTLGRYAINEAIKVLTEKGWLRTERTKKDNGQFWPYFFSHS
jgi:predicted transcriptional regulator